MLTTSQKRTAWNLLQAAIPAYLIGNEAVFQSALLAPYPESIKVFFDNSNERNSIATASLPIQQIMSADQIIAELENWIERHRMISGRWVVGIRHHWRIHSYNGEEFGLATCAWMILKADSPRDAFKALGELRKRGYHTPIYVTEDENHRQVFACLYRYDWN